MNEHAVHHAWTDRLSEHLDNELSPTERAEIETHLAECDTCREILASLQAVVADARAVEDVAPVHDLWPGVATAVAHTAQPRRISLSVPQLVAASFFVALIGGLATLAMMGGAEAPARAGSTPPATAVSVKVALDDATSDRAAGDLLKTLNENRATLDPKTVEVLERSVATIDRAIVEARAALAVDPGNVYLSNHLARERRLKLAVLRRVNNLTEVRQ